MSSASGTIPYSDEELQMTPAQVAIYSLRDLDQKVTETCTELRQTSFKNTDRSVYKADTAIQTQIQNIWEAACARFMGGPAKEGELADPVAAIEACKEQLEVLQKKMEAELTKRKGN